MRNLPLWPVARLEEALYRLGGRDGLSPTFGAIADAVVTPRELQAWLYAAASRASLEAEPLHVQGGLLEQALRASAPALVVVSWGALAVERVRGGRATLLRPDGGTERVGLDEVCEAVRALWGRKYGLDSVDALVERAGVSRGRRAKVRSSLLRAQLAFRPVEVGWTVRPSAGAGWGEQLARSGQARNLAKFALAFAGLQATTVGAWYFLGRGALTGHFDPGWLVAWAVALVSAAVLQTLSSFFEGSASIAAGAALKKRLLLGALRLAPEAMRHEGLGRAMGRVLEAESLEEFSLAGGGLAVVAAFEFLVAMAIASRASAALFVSLSAAFVATLWACRGHYRRCLAWAAARLALTHDLVEQLVGHRTRMAQGDAGRLHEGEDAALAAYAKVSRDMDRFSGAVSVLLPRGVLAVGASALAPTFFEGRDRVALWVGVGAVLLSQRALTRLATGVGTLLEGLVAWHGAAPLLRAAKGAEEPATEIGLAASLRTSEPGETLLEARRLDYRFGPERPPVLRAASLSIKSGDRVLVEGASGSGKSTLVSVLAGLRAPQAGLVLLGGLDRRTLGAAAYRKKVTVAPQQHENHILQGPLAFNLLLGREWPASPDEALEAEAVCRELGLGDLLDRMPSGIMQTVGSTGWRLSHGEQSRVFVARALLQGSELVVLDESFAALDPESLEGVMACVRNRARTLVVVAHP